MSYTLGVPSDAYRYLDGRGGRSYVPKYILPEDPCTPCTCFHSLTYVTYRHAVYIRCHHKNNCNHRFQNLFQTNPFEKQCTPHPIHPSEEPCTSSTYFHHLTCITYKHAIYMRCHHKNNCNHRFSNLFQHIPLRSYVHSVHPFEEPCTPSTSFGGDLYPIHILLRSYVLQGRTFIISPALHTNMNFTWDDIIKFNYRFSNLFHHIWFPNIKQSITFLIK